jgi:hypothetical protein
MHQVNSVAYWWVDHNGCSISGGGGKEVCFCLVRKGNGSRLGFYSSLAIAKANIDAWREGRAYSRQM